MFGSEAGPFLTDRMSGHVVQKKKRRITLARVSVDATLPVEVDVIAPVIVERLIVSVSTSVCSTPISAPMERRSTML